MNRVPRPAVGLRYPAIYGLIALSTLAVPAVSRAQPVIATIAGTGTGGYSGDGGAASGAQLNFPSGVAVDSAGNIYIADTSNSRVRKIDASGNISTVAGCGSLTVACALGGLGDGGPAINAPITGPQRVAVDSKGNIYIADSGTNRVRKVDTSGTLSTVAGGGSADPGDGGPATSAVLKNPLGIAVDSSGNVYIADLDHNRIRKVDAAGIITTVAGNGTEGFSGDGGPATSAALSNPEGVAVDAAGNLYIADTNNFRIRKVDTAGIIATVAGGSGGFSGDGGPATAASFGGLLDVVVDGAGNLYVTDAFNNRIRKIDTAGIVTTVAGNGTAGYSGDGGPAIDAAIFTPGSLALGPSGDLYIADSLNNRVRRISGLSSSPSSAPSISANGVVNGAGFQPGIVSGSWATIKGSNLSPATDTWANSIVNGKLPTMLDGVSVTIGGKPAYVYYVSPGQINLLVPDVPPGPADVIVSTSAGASAAFTVTASQYAPAFFPWPGNQVVATRQDFSLAAKNDTFTGATTVPAKPGDVLILWGTGFGPTNPAAPTGVQVPADKTYATGALPTVTVGDVPATVYGAALAPGFAGLYQVAIQVPSSLADGDWPVVAVIGGVKSPAGMLLSVKK